ncbi:MAG TPA: hypothetical protein VLZ75_08250 [Chitinophagales bacterium]|nr:hypothetical protein [Chitinophagales bacterium]
MQSKEELIIKYFSRQLDAEEQKIFDLWMLEDIDFKNQVEFEKATQEAIKRNERDDLKRFLQGLDIPKQNKTFQWIAIAASFIGIVLISIFSIYYYSSTDSSNLYAEYFQPYPNEVVPLVRGQVESSTELKAFNAYELENYELSANLFENIKEDYALLYAGISNLELNQNQKAITQLQTLSLQNGKYQEPAEWYLALAYLKNKENKKAKGILKLIVQNHQQFSEQASELLERL